MAHISPGKDYQQMIHPVSSATEETLTSLQTVEEGWLVQGEIRALRQLNKHFNPTTNSTSLSSITHSLRTHFQF